MAVVILPYGRDGAMELEIPGRNLAGVLSPPPAAASTRPLELVREALVHPVGRPRLRDLARTRNSAAIIISDATRPNVELWAVPAVLEELSAGGITLDRVVFAVGTGFHRPATKDELAQKLGVSLAAGARIVNHQALESPVELVGRTAAGVPALINKEVMAAELKVAIGTVLPHPFAGYSGGGKAVSVGVAGRDTIAATHTPAMVEHAATGLGRIEGNPFYETSLEIARMVELDFIVNATVTPDGALVCVSAGEVEAAHRALVESSADSMFKVAFDEPADVVIVCSGHPKDGNLYHVAAEGICVVAGDANPTSCVVDGGTIIAVSPMEEGIYNRAFHSELSTAEQASDTVARLRTATITEPGQHRAFGLAKILAGHEVIVAQSRMSPETVRAAKMTPLGTAQEALSYALAKHGAGASVMVVRNSHRLIPIQT
ncbi:MAG: nickel-dependent lactate racemase [Firmicutes bacterium]|nr:nickel-dependent lactate racemase [Bacillota bacterium]